MATNYKLRRIIPQDECPGTCCKMTPLEPGPDGVCVHWSADANERPNGGCTLMNRDGTADYVALDHSSANTKEKFEKTCVHYPVPALIPALDTRYPSKFGRAFGEACPCFEWEEINDGD